MNEVLIYGYIYDFSAKEFVQSFSEIEGDSIVCRINTDGGEPEAGWSMLARLAEFAGTKLVKVDGKAYSMGSFALCYADDSECLDVSQFMLHRASYGLWYEQEYMDDAARVNLVSINKKLRQALEATIDVAKFENLKVCKDNGITVERLFSMDERVDVFLTADEAKKIGLVKRIVQLTPQKAKSINQKVAKIAASGPNGESLMVKAAEVAPKEVIESKTEHKNEIMTPEEFKSKHPEAYAAIVGIGATQEKDRVASWMAWSEIDADRVKTGIESGLPVAQKDISEFQVSAMKKMNLDALRAEGENDPNGNGTGVDTPPDKVDVNADANAKSVNDWTEKILGRKVD